MRVVFQNYATGELGIAEVATPLATPGRLIVQTRASLVSVGTERAIIDVARKTLLGKALARPDWVRQVVDKVRTEGLAEAYRQSRARLDTPVPLGYSSAGIVLETGHQVTGFAVGDRVACAGHGYASHAQVVSVPRNLCTRVPDGVSFEQAAFVALGGIALEAVRLAHVEIGHRVAVIGLGLLGQLAIQILKASGCRVLGTDLAPEKLALARVLGADVAVDAASDMVTFVREFTDGHGADSVLIMAATESNQPIEQAAEACRERGRIVATGLVGLNIPRQAFYEKEIEFVVSRAWGPGLYDADYEERGVPYPLPYVRWTAQRNMAAFLDLVAEGRVQVEPLITHRFPFERALDAYGVILEGKASCIGVVLTYSHEVDLSRTVVLQRQRGQIEQRSSASTVPSAPPASSAPSVVGVGLIGAGLYARGTLLPALQKVKGVRHVGVATASGVSGQHVGDKFGFAYCTTDYREILQDDNVQVVLILTRHGSHADLVGQALAVGKHVFVEKPLALDEAQLQQVIQAHQGTPGQLMVGFNRRFAPTTAFAVERLVRVARPLLIAARVNVGHIPREAWTYDPEQGGGNIIGEVCHFVDLIQALTGALPVGVYACAVHAASEAVIAQDNVVITLTMTDGSTGAIVYTTLGDKAFERERVEILGGGAACVIENFKTATWSQAGRRERWGNSFSGVDRGHRDEIQALIDAVRLGRPFPVPFEEYVATTRATFAAMRSLAEKRSVSLSEFEKTSGESA